MDKVNSAVVSRIENGNSRLVPPPPPLAVQSTAIRSASPVCTLYAASMNTDLDLRSRISIVGSYALKGSVWALTVVDIGPPEGVRRRSRGVEQ